LFEFISKVLFSQLLVTMLLSVKHRNPFHKMSKTLTGEATK